MATETKNTKAYYDTEIPSSWEVKKLGTLVEIVSGLSPSLFNLDIIGKYPYLKVEDLNNCKKYQIESREYSNDEKYLVPKDSVIFPKRGAAILNNKVRINSLAVQMDTNLMAIYPKSESLSCEYLYYQITFEQLHKIADTSTIPQINNKHIIPYSFPLPPLSEQKAIAQVLSTADAAIHTTEKLIAQKELRKKWFMQQLLTGKKRLMGFENTKWKKQPLGNFIQYVVRQVDKPKEPYLGIGLRSHGKGTFLKHDEQPEKNSMDKFYVVRPNDLIVNITFAWEQAIAIVQPEDDGALASHRFPTYTFIEEKGHPDFFRFFILRPRMKYMLKLISPGGTGRNRVMSKSDFIKLEFLLPDFKEQTAIAQVLQSVDKEINLLKAKAEKLREQKKGLMQQLLTGKSEIKAMTTKLLTFDDALKQAASYNKKNLLLGNGFSVACVPTIFTYSSLYKQADFSKMPEVKEVFKNLKTQDFEEVIHALEHARIVLPSYKSNLPKTLAKLEKHAQKTKEILIQTIAKNHPERPTSIEEGKYKACVQFLNNFLGNDGVIYSLNYDLLLYWTLMYGLNEKLLNAEPNDGFGKDVELNDAGIPVSVSDYVIWQGDSNAHGQNIHYLHGALHVFEREAEIEKFTWVNTGKPLIEQTREALEANRFPLFVAEGNSTKKLTRITHSGYLYHSYKSFSQRMKTGNKRSTACLFTYGVSFSANDEHILKKITAGKINHLFVSIYGNPDSTKNKSIIQAAESRKRRNQDFIISYYDAESAQIWG